MSTKTNWISVEKDLPKLDTEVLIKLLMIEDMPSVFYVAKRHKTRSGGWTWKTKDRHNFETLFEIDCEVESWCEIPK